MLIKKNNCWEMKKKKRPYRYMNLKGISLSIFKKTLPYFQKRFVTLVPKY